LPPPAVYAVETHVKGSRFLGAMHLGPRPTFRDGALSVEAHLLKFHNSMYGKEIEFTILGKIREVRFFSSPQNLKHQIESDIRIIKSRFSNPSGR
jgi:riboflavin kinase / FMN adenylyltransferase